MRTDVLRRLAMCALLVTGTSGCVGMAVGAATDAAIEVGKVPFKVGGAVVDVVRSDKKKADDEKDEQDNE